MVDWHNSFLEQLSAEITTTAEGDSRLEILLTDFIVAARAGKELSRTSHFGANLAMNSAADDADDIDWSVMTHPGSVIWAALIHVLSSHPESAKKFREAAYASYRTSASIAGAFGSAHRFKWHVTTTAGSFAAAAASNFLLSLNPEQSLSSYLNVASNMGGIAIADRRTGAALFNRAAALTLGVLSSEGAASGIPSAQNIWQGERGLINLFSLTEDQASAKIRDGISTAGLRLFHCNGFMQGAIEGITYLKESLGGELLSMRVGLTAAGLGFLDGSVGGDYWNAQHAAALAWDRENVEKNLALVEVFPSDVPFGGAEVEIKTSLGQESFFVKAAPGSDFDSAKEKDWRTEKYHRLVGPEKTLQAQEFSSRLLSGVCDLPRLKEFLS